MENSHPAIIEPDVFDMAQHEMEKRKSSKIESELLARRVQKAQIGEFLDTLNTGVMTEFHDEVFRAVANSITVG